MIAIIWPVSLPLVIAFNVYCFVSEKHYRYKHRNDPKVDWSEVFKAGSMTAQIAEAQPTVEKTPHLLETKPAERI